MKIPTLIFNLLFVYQVLNAQPCAQTNVTIKTHADLQAFVSNSGGCTDITGDLFITDEVQHLDGLEKIEKIHGSLTISNTTQLESIRGLSGLKEVIGYIRIQNNPKLLSLQGLDNLGKVRGDFFYFSNNKHIKNLMPLSKLDSIHGIFQLYELDSLESLTGLENLNYIGNDFAIFKNDKLLTLSGVQSLKTVAQSMRIYDNPTLTTLTHLSSNLTIGNLLVINDNPMLSACNAGPICNLLQTKPDNCIVSNNAIACSSKYEILQLCISNLNETTPKTVVIYPNPTASKIWIYGLEEKTEIKIYNSLGIQVKTVYSNEDIDMSTLQNGSYFIQIVNQHYPIIKL